MISSSFLPTGKLLETPPETCRVPFLLKMSQEDVLVVVWEIGVERDRAVGVTVCRYQRNRDPLARDRMVAVKWCRLGPKESEIRGPFLHEFMSPKCHHRWAVRSNLHEAHPRFYAQKADFLKASCVRRKLCKPGLAPAKVDSARISRGQGAGHWDRSRF